MPFVNKFKILVCTACLMLVGQGFALDCATGTGWGDFLTQEASKPNGKTYYEIDTPEKLAWFACKVTNKALSSEVFKLTKSLDMQGKLFIPIGSGTGEDTGFKGTFDGQGFTISNLYINTSEINSDVSSITGKTKNGVAAYTQNIGLFGILSQNGTIKNLILKDVQIYAAASSGTTGIGSDKPISVGSVVGWVGAADKKVGKIENIVASGSIETSGATNRVGGIAGNVKFVTISNCVSSVSVTASGTSTNVGGVVGAIRNNGNVTLTSNVYSGDHLYTVDGSIGAIAGSYENTSGTLTTEDMYYSEEFCESLGEGETCSGIGLSNGTAFNTKETDNLNSEEVVCALNCGTWNEENKICEGDTSEVWSVGQSSLSMNGSDGYKITFNANGGVFASGAKTSKILSKNATITADEIGVPTREGKKFAGWATKADTTEPNPNLGVARAATTIYAVWYDFYTVSFETNPETHATETVQVPKHGTVSVEGFTVPATYTVADPQNPGTPIKYYFTGWGNRSKMLDVGVDPTAEDTVHLADIDVVDNVNLYAVWTKAKTFSVTFDATLHGKTDVRIIKIVNEGDPVSEPDPNDIISDAGYEVAGWCLVEACTESNEYDFDSPLEGNLLLYARWNVIQYSITYENMNGASNADNPSNYNVGSDDIVFAAPTKVGSVFEGWFYDAEFTNPATQIETGSTGDKTIYAKWMQITYTIQYLSGNTIYATAKNVTKNHGETIQLNGALDEFAHNGCSQDGWSRVDYGQDGYGIDYELGADYEDNANLKLFPHWTCNTYTITYEIFGASATNRNPTQYMGPAKLTLENAFDPAKKYFFMDNWYKEPTFKTAIRDVQNIDADLTLYARWYNKITYKPGSNVSGAKNLEEKKDFDKTYKFKTSIDKYVRANYTLDGWSLTDGGEKVYGLGDAYTTNANLTLYPHWTANTHTITYNNVETSELPEGYPETYTHEASVTLPVPTRNGYEFLGWFVDGEFNGDAVTEIPEGQTEDKEFFAKWSDPIEYAITYVGADDLENLNPTSYTVLENDLALLPVAKSGFKFLGWFNASDELVESISAGSTGDITLTAKWAEFPITVATYGGVTILENEDGTRTAAIDASSMETVEIAEDVSVDNVTFDRAFTVGATSTIMLPFSIATSKVSGGKFYEFADLQKNEETGRWAASVKPPEQSELQANKPYLFIPEETSIVFNLGGEPVSLNTSVMNPSTSGNWSFKGVYEKTVFTEEHPELGKAYGFAAENKDGFKLGQFVKFGSGAWLRPFRAYLAYNESGALAKSTRSVRASLVNGELPETIDVEIQDGTTRVIGGGTLNTRTGEIKMDRWYDMNGRRLNSKPTTRGTYYYNGKRIVVR